jgi:hypothetical protein
VELALKTCSTCPAVAPCREFAVPLPALRGVWGGTTTEGRHRLRRLTTMAATISAEDLEGPSDAELLAEELASANGHSNGATAPPQVVAEEVASLVVPTCPICGDVLTADRLRIGAKSCSKETCQKERKRQRDAAVKERSKPAVAVTAPSYPPDGLVGLVADLVATVRRHPSAAVSVRLDGVRISVKAAPA